MALFDAIRYPITDIFDPKQVNCLPRPILVEWGRILTMGITQDDFDTKRKNINYSWLAFQCISRRCHGNDNIDDQTFFAFKSYYTRLLQQLIADYEPESKS